MVPRTFILGLVLSIAPVCACGADLIVSAPGGGPVTLHDGSYALDLNGDGTTDLTLFDQPAYGSGANNVVGSKVHVLQAVGVGVYRGTGTGEEAVALNLGDQVGTNTSEFVYSEFGLLSDAVIQWYYDPSQLQWADGARHFLGMDLLSGADHHYGWIELSLQPSRAATTDQPWYDLTVYSWAYESAANQTITVPEPSIPATLVVVAVAGLSVRRRHEARRAAG